MNLRNGYTFFLVAGALFCLSNQSSLTGAEAQPRADFPFSRTRPSRVARSQPGYVPASAVAQPARLPANQKSGNQAAYAQGSPQREPAHQRNSSAPTTFQTIQTGQVARTSLKQPLPATESPRVIGGAQSDKPGGKPARKGRAKTLVSPGKLLTAVSFVIVLIILTARFWRRHLPGSSRPIPPELLTVLGERKLNKQHSVSLVRLGSRILVLGVSGEGVRTLAEITDPVEVDLLSGMARSSQPEAAFTSALGSFMKKSPTSTASLGARTAQQTSATLREPARAEVPRG